MLPRLSRAVYQICNRAGTTSRNIECVRNGGFTAFTRPRIYSKVAAAEILDSPDSASVTRSEVLA